MKTEINFGGGYEYGGERFEGFLRDALNRNGYELVSAIHRGHGHGGSVFVDGELVGHTHPAHHAIELAEDWERDAEAAEGW